MKIVTWSCDEPGCKETTAKQDAFEWQNGWHLVTTAVCESRGEYGVRRHYCRRCWPKIAIALGIGEDAT